MNTATTGAPQLPPGTVIDGTYTTGAVVRSRLGAVTYEATDLSGARVGVTVYAPECFVSPVALERSLRELRQVEKVHAPQVLRVLDAGKMAKGGIYEVHENVSGPSLADAAVPRAEVAPLIHDIVAGLQAAQKVGVLHRNLGAEAILRVAKGIKLTGFAVGDPQGGVSFGALDCIAPEQVEGKNIDERTLVYNLAALTYRLLRGASLFTGGDTGTQLLQAAASQPDAETMPAALFAALAKDPKARPNLLAKFLADLDAIVREFPETPQGSGAREPSAPVSVAAAEPPPAPLFSLDPLPDPEEQVRPSPVREAPSREPAVTSAPATNRASAASDERDDDATLDALMADNDAPNLPSGPDLASRPASPESPSKPEPAAKSEPARPTPVATSAAKAPVAAPPTLKPIVGPPTLTPKAAPTLAPPPGLGKPAVPTIGAPPGLGKPAVPTIGPPTIGPPTIGAPTVAAPTLSAPTLSAPSFGAPAVAAPAVAAPAVAAPSAVPPVAAAPAAAVGAAKPRTRGWTMFMEVTEDEANTSPAPGLPQAGAPAPAPAAAVAAAPLPAPAPTPAAPATPGGEVKPSTRGWTMIMDEPEADASTSMLTNPVTAAATPLPPSPTTRGWTMLEELNDSLPPGAVPVAPPPSQAPVSVSPSAGVATEPSGVSSAPSSRGWTMFMEAELQAKPEDAAAGEPQEVEPEEFEGEMTTETGTVVAFAPTAAEPNSSFRREPAAGPDLTASEPMTSFGARLRGEDKPSKPLEDEVPQPLPAPVESAPSPAAEIPSFADNNLNLIPIDPNKAATKRPPVEPDPVEPEPTESGSNTKMIVGLLVVLAIVLGLYFALR